MKAKFLLDTNVFSEPLKVSPNKNVLANLKSHGTELALASPVWHEMLTGLYRLPRSKKRSAIENYLSAIALPILPYDGEAACWHAKERVRLMNSGLTPPFVDGQIAAIAATQSLILVTFNPADFAHFDGLFVVDWR